MRVGVDTGGTFTDVVAVDDDGRLHVVKLPSVPADPARAVREGIERVRALAGAPPREVVHSTTVATNALLERSGGPTVLVTTEGFEDVLVLGRQARPVLYALHPVVPPPLVDDAHRLGVAERLGPSGEVRQPLDEEALAALLERVRALQPRSIAVCLLHAYANPAHELRVEAALAPLGVPLSLSSRVLPLYREYERTSTTVVDAYVRPLVAAYLDRLAAALAGEAPGARLRVMLSSGGAVAAPLAAARPVTTLLSGPAAGVVGAVAVAGAAGFADLITLDMGGTSTDVALVRGGRVATTEEASVAGHPIQLPMLAIHTVGAGGGSIAWIDPGGALKVGPASAGAVPGPAAYGRGGSAPTLTDAYVVLGRLPAGPAEGRPLALDADLARQALAPLAAALGRTVEETAEAVVAVGEAVMARAVKVVSVERGHDPRDFVLVPFGGAGGLSAWALAEELGMARVLVPPAPGLLCAWGALGADVVHELVDARLGPAGDALPAAALAPELAALTARGEALLDADRVPAARRRLVGAATLRYRGQSFELEVALEGDLVAAFHAAHQARYGYALFDHPVELCSLRLRAVGVAEPVPLPAEALEPGPAERGRGTLLYRGRAYGAAQLLRRRLPPGTRVEGPALILEYSATTFVPPGVTAEVLPGGALLLG